MTPLDTLAELAKAATPYETHARIASTEYLQYLNAAQPELILALIDVVYAALGDAGSYDIDEALCRLEALCPRS